MRTSLSFLLALLLAGSNANAQVSSSCTPSPALTAWYVNDARDIALQRMYAFRSADTSLINIPSVYSDSVLKGIAAVFYTGAAIEADSVFDAYCIHQSSFIRKSLVVKVDPTYSWTNAWKIHNTVTGNAPLDNFMSRYGFTLDNYYENASSAEYLRDQAIISTNQSINTWAFMDSIALFEGVVYSEINPTPWYQQTFIDLNKGASDTLTFTLGWGDCPAGCTSYKQWKYAVDNTCTVTFLGTAEHGLPFDRPAPTNCDLSHLAAPAVNKPHDVKVYPNPAKDVLHVDVNGIKGARYTICNVYGQVVSQGMASGRVSVNMTPFASGIYMLQLADDSGILYHQAIIKE